MCVSVFAYVYVCLRCARLVPAEVREGIGLLGSGVTDGSEPPSGFWESNPTPMQGKPVFLIT